MTGAAGRILSNKCVLHKVKVLIYKTMIRPSVTHASAIWANKMNIKRLEAMERRVFRRILNMNRNPNNQHYISNDKIYECMETERLSVALRKMKKSYIRRLKRHSNPLVVCMMAERRERKRERFGGTSSQ